VVCGSPNSVPASVSSENGTPEQYSSAKKFSVYPRMAYSSPMFCTGVGATFLSTVMAREAPDRARCMLR